MKKNIFINCYPKIIILPSSLNTQEIKNILKKENPQIKIIYHYLIKKINYCLLFFIQFYIETT